MRSYTGDPNARPLSDYENGITGSCLCGSITVKVTQKDLFTKPNGHICHCENCRKGSGSTGLYLLILPVKNVEVSDAQHCLKTYIDDNNTTSGGGVPRSFCSNCGSGIGGFPPKDSDFKYALLVTGIFPRIPQPEFELFTAHQHPWEKSIEGAKQYQYCDEVVQYFKGADD